MWVRTASYLQFYIIINAFSVRNGLLVANETNKTDYFNVQNGFNEESIKTMKADAKIFTDVLKNISRVNTALRDLIKNYEQLQKMYKTQVSFESSYEVDTEADENVNKRSHNNDRIKIRLKHTSTTRKLSDEAITQMIISDEKYDDFKEFTTESGIVEISNKVENRIPNIEALKHGKAINSKKNESEFYSDESMFSETSSSESSEDMDLDSDKKSSEILTIGTNLSKETNSKDEKNINTLEPREIIEELKLLKNQSDSGYESAKLYKVLQTDESENKARNYRTKSEEKRVKGSGKYSRAGNNKRSFSKYKTLVQKSPHKNIGYRPIHKKLKKPQTKQESMFLRRNKTFKDYNDMRKIKKTALVILTQNKKKGTVKDISDTTEDDDRIKKELFKTDVLRQAYGDACLKLVNRKCFRACKKVNKQVCRHYHCKSDYKQSFKDYAKKGCVKAFKINNKTSTHNFRANSLNSFNETDMSFVDFTRGGYFENCVLSGRAGSLDDIQNKPVTLSNRAQIEKKKTISIVTTTPAKEESELNILRDRYERACKKASSKNCMGACKYAADRTCAKFKCRSRRKKDYSKACKRECNIAYDVRGDSDSSSSSSYDSDTSSTDTD